MHIDQYLPVVLVSVTIAVCFGYAVRKLRGRHLAIKQLRARCILATELMGLQIPNSRKWTKIARNGKTILPGNGVIYFNASGRQPSFDYAVELAIELSRIGFKNKRGIKLSIALEDIKYPTVIYTDGLKRVDIEIPFKMPARKLAGFVYHFIK